MKKLKVLGQELKVQISPTFLQNAACPAYLKFHYVDRIGDRFIRIAAERGKTAHAAIADLLKVCLDEKIKVQALEDGMLREALQKHLPVSIMSETALIYSWLVLWRDRYQIPTNIHGIEDKIALDDDYDEVDWKESAYRGIIDVSQIGGTHAIVTDWKSQPHIHPQNELDTHEQGTMYCWLFQKMYPHLKTFTFRIWYLRYGFYMETMRTEEDLAAFENALIIRERKITEIADWNPIPGKHCQYCDYIHLCPIAQDLSPVNPEIITQDQAELAAQRVTVMEALTKQLKDKLKIYVKKNDEIVINEKGYRLGFRHTAGIRYPADKVEAILLEAGRNLSDVVDNAGKKQVDKLIKALRKDEPDLAQLLEDTAVEKHETKFCGYTPGSQDDDVPE